MKAINEASKRFSKDKWSNKDQDRTRNKKKVTKGHLDHKDKTIKHVNNDKT